MENTNEMKIVFDSRPENEGLARVAVAAFCTQLNPTLEEVSDLKTAVSEAVTNCIIHAYEGKVQKIEVRCRMQGRVIWVDVIDKGIGIENRKPWNRCLLPSRRRTDPGWDLPLWKHLWTR